ncbi:MAG: 4Fe-4S ferredoxin [Nitrospirae bacterium]|nr:4Fe-4S ferredoxin [Nitrospirota bacterium]
MSIDRREFLKFAGASTLFGLGGITAVQELLKTGAGASQVLVDEKALSANRWAMVIDISKFKTEADYKNVIQACHSIHNVPDIGNPKDEVKWIWTDTYEHTFPGQENEYMPFIKEENPEYPTRTMGVVEKCTFCFERLAKGLQPACVEKSNGGLIFGDLSDPNSEVRKVLSTHYSIRRKPEIGTQPSVYYIIGGSENA